MSDALTRLTARLAESAPGLRLETGPGTGAYAYDASNYRIPPRAVAFPRSADDVVAVVRACRETGVPVTARGGGTSMAGNAVGPGVVLDFSRHMNRILDLDPVAGLARVQAGTVLDALCGAAAPYGLTFGPDPSSHSRCTIGGMIGNDACGNRSVRHGRTGGHVEALEIVTAGGVRAVADHAGLHPVDPADAEHVARLEADVRRLVDAHLAPIRTELGRIPRQVSGYQLHHLLPERGFDMARALVGTEGTCAVVTAATVRLVATARATALLTLGYDDVVAAAEDIPEILRRHPTAVEGMDEAIVATMRARRGPGSVTGLPEGRAWLYVELDGDDPAAVETRAAELLDVLKARGRMTGGRVVTSTAERRSLWRVREDGAGLTARLVPDGEPDSGEPSDRGPWPGGVSGDGVSGGRGAWPGGVSGGGVSGGRVLGDRGSWPGGVSGGGVSGGGEPSGRGAWPGGVSGGGVSGDRGAWPGGVSGGGVSGDRGAWPGGVSGGGVSGDRGAWPGGVSGGGGSGGRGARPGGVAGGGVSGGRGAGGRESWPGWEDAAVAPENLAGYLRDFRGLLASHGFTGVLYGHFGAGCVHVRIDFDFASVKGRDAARRFLQEAAALVVAHGGTLSGEHGDGRARGELLEVMYSHRMIRAFAAFKEAFDPEGLLNPGVIVAPAPLDAGLAAHRNRPPATVFTFPHDEDGFAGAARRCVGVGRCRSDAGGVMCPSYRATGEENDSTRGRARMLQEMVRGETVTDGWRSAEVRDALDLCLSCKACSSDCPVGVDMATYKAEFLHHHYKGRIRPRAHYSLGWLPLTSVLAGRAARPVNALLRGPLGGGLARLGGVTTQRTIPSFASRRALRRVLRATRTDAPATALLFVDSFTRAFRPHVAGAARRVLADAGVPTTAETGLCCGLTWVSTGQLSVARRVMARTVTRLDNGDARPVVVAEPSCAAALKRDVPELLGTAAARRVADRVHTFTGALTGLAEPGWTPPSLPERVVLQTHCHEYATFPGRRPADLLRRLGVRTVDEAEGCCGLAGNFGFEEQHYATSMAVAGLALAPRLDGLGGTSPDGTRTAVVADGFSCATQIDHLTAGRDVRALHLAELLDPAADRPGETP
ncbi:FAD-binding and (Fe-S)-binding domain-containing protein [Streptomyces sp. WAC 01420]|uniref:FAD-binding and (Fe-S)-binding domain-containing protein n=1 Tax=Streptomyces sp. WAC 01420 TaxID=2203203 RepID=UPI0021AFA3B2|nr:FAD-binding and (Fe-S)-binding domain-containing protein [Streptomyces sp. WAC 01420]